MSAARWRTWDEIKADRPLTPEQDARVKELKKRMLAEHRASRLAEIRTAYGLNQKELADRLGVTQSRVSRIEHGNVDQSELATLRAYVAALGGEVEIVAKIGDEEITVG